MDTDPESLAASAALAGGWAQDLLTAHARTDALIDAARRGWPGRSAAALPETAERWTATTTAICDRLSAHAEALRTAAAMAVAADEAGAGRLK